VKPAQKIAYQRAIVAERVEKILGDEVICKQCGATYKTMNDLCSAPLDVRCPGFNRIDEVQMPIEDEVFGFNR